MPLLNYRRANGLATAINEFNHTCRLIMGENVRPTIIRRVITRAEARFLSVMNTAARGDDYDQRWLAANRREINEMLASFDQMRENLDEPRPANIQQDFQNMHRQFADAESVYQSKTSVAASAALRAAVYGGLALAAGVTATGISAFSFFGGPAVGGAVTSTVGGVSLLASGAATVYGGIRGAAQARTDIENGLRAEFCN